MRIACVLLALALAGCTSQNAQNDRERDGGQVEIIRDLAYVTGKDADPVRHRLDLYLPKTKQDFPVVLYLHGGAWKTGTKESFAEAARVLARQGIGVSCSNYRLSPQVMHPGHIEDVARAFAWLHKNIGKYGGNNKALFVSGHSAGGHLAALLATDETHLQAVGLSLDDIRGAIPISGVYRLTDRQSRTFHSEKVRTLASPIEHVSGKRPPFLIIYAEDELADFAERSPEMANLLRSAGNDASAMMMKGRGHSSIVTGMVNEDDPATRALVAFVTRHAAVTAK